MHRDVEAADRTLMRLSDLLRLTLENIGQQEIPLQAELDFLSKYLQIEQTRFADRLIVRFDVQPETLDTLVPNLILQPLVENAIKHGVAKKSGPGHIDISARREGDKLWMEVRDDGVGLSEDALTALQKGIGVSTTRARLQHLFGADYRFEFHRQPSGLSVVVAIPWQIEVRTRAEQASQSGGTQMEIPRMSATGGLEPSQTASLGGERTTSIQHSAFSMSAFLRGHHGHQPHRRASRRRASRAGKHASDDRHEKDQDARSSTTSRSPASGWPRCSRARRTSRWWASAATARRR